VTDLLDKDTLSRWLTNLWPVTCLTCGEPLGSKADLSADPLTGGTVLLSMHHSACRASGDRPADGAVTMHPPTSSFVAGYLTPPRPGGAAAPTSRQRRQPLRRKPRQGSICSGGTASSRRACGLNASLRTRVPRLSA
jgi:hypothetical protein